jgi:hypothetical protein
MCDMIYSSRVPATYNSTVVMVTVTGNGDVHTYMYWCLSAAIFEG